METFRERYTHETIAFSPGQGDLTIRVGHPRLCVRGRTETGEVNWAALEIEYRPARLLLEWAALTGYLDELATTPASLEQVALQIAAYVKDRIAPAAVRVTLRTVGDRGFSFEVCAT